ncbi:MAG TPA: amidophosphoribosyltransferase [Candidatus Coprenecus stercoripullorum]|nr:amidophosphoribosyltransferase [Candidatus Coprenecus stercoripullorum]
MGGIFGVISTQKCTNDLFYGTDYHSHLGTRRGGMAVYNGNGIFARDIHSLESSYFRVKFEHDLYKYTGKAGIGVISDTDAQPIVVNSHLGRFAIVTVGRICNIDALERELLAENKNFTELSSGKTNPTELIAQILTCSPSFEEGIRAVQRKVKGSCSFLILTENCIIACRDLYGRTPLIIGRKDDTGAEGEKETAHAVASETCCFPTLGYKEEYILGPGEAVRMTADGYTTVVERSRRMQICSFLWIYYGYPASSYEDINVDEVRYRLGREMAAEDGAEIDTACSIPDSGTCMAIGYSDGKKVPFRNAYVKYTPTWPRSFMPVNQESRNLVAKMKLIPNGSILRDRRLVFCDDSIVRGTQLRNNVKNLYDYGAKEIHVRISCPPLIYPCPFINFSESRSPLELITRRYIQEKEGRHDRNLDRYVESGTEEYKGMVEYIRKQINVASLKFNTVQGLVSAIGLPQEQICTHCFNGCSYGHE